MPDDFFVLANVIEAGLWTTMAVIMSIVGVRSPRERRACLIAAATSWRLERQT